MKVEHLNLQLMLRCIHNMEALACCICIGLMCYTLGMFTALMLYAWLDERSDRYAGIKWSSVLDTCVKYAGEGT